MEKQVKSNNVHKIVGILWKARVLVENRERFCGALGLPGGIVVDMKKEYGFDSKGFLTKALDEWISNFGVKATFGRLIQILENEGYINVADELTKALHTGQLDSEEGITHNTRTSRKFILKCLMYTLPVSTIIVVVLMYQVPQTELPYWLNLLYHNLLGVDSRKDDSIGFSFEIPEPTLHFTGREKELLELHNTVMSLNSGDGAVIAALSGMGGIGKTTLAAQYVWKYHEGIFSNVIWINAENSASLRSSFSRLAIELKLMDQTSPTSEEFKKIISDVYKEFVKSRTLLIFDNAENYEEIQPYLPTPNLKAIHPHILITSRNNKWNDKFQIIELGLFTPEEALKFLEDYLGLTSPEEFSATEKLSEALGYLPLAVRQAGAYIKVEKDEAIPRKSTRESLEKYLRTFEKDYEDLLNYEYWKTTGEANERTTLVTWNITLEKIKKENKICEKIMEFIAYLDPDEIDIDVLEKLDERATKDSSSSKSDESSDSDGDSPIKFAINLLNQYSIIKKNMEYGSISVHRLVQKVIRMQNRYREKELLLNAIYIVDRFRIYGYYLSLWENAMQYDEIVERHPNFGIQACEELIMYYSVKWDEEADDLMKIIKKAMKIFKRIHPHVVVYRQALMSLEIQLFCKYSCSNIDRISELVNEILLNWEEFVRAGKSYSIILVLTAQHLSSFTERLSEDKDELLGHMAYEVFQMFFAVVKFRNEEVAIANFFIFHIHDYIRLMVILNKTGEAVQVTRKFSNISNKIQNSGDDDFLEHFANSLIAREEAEFAPNVELVKYSLEVNEKLYKMSFSKCDIHGVREALLHRAFCLFRLGDAESKEEGFQICEAIVEDSETDFQYLVLFSNKFLPISCMLVEFGYFELALKFIKLMKKHGKPTVNIKLERGYFTQLLKKLDLQIDYNRNYDFWEKLKEIIVVLEERIEPKHTIG